MLDPGTAVNNLCVCVRIEGAVDSEKLAWSANQVLARHDVLRTSFALESGKAVARIAADLSIALTVVHLAGRPDPLAEALRLAEREARQPFDLSRAPLLRVQMFDLGAHTHVLLVIVHHSIADGWSLGVFLRDLLALYGAFGAEAEQLPALPIQYGDFAAWQRDPQHAPRYEGQLQYWNARLGGELPILDLPPDRPRGARQTFVGATHRIRIPPAVMGDLRRLSRRCDVTPFMLLMGAFQVLLHRWCGQDDIVVGTPTAGRLHPETADLIGAFINTLVFRTDLSGDPTFTALLGRVRQVALEAYANQDVPFERLVAELRPQRDLSRTPVFQVMLILQNSPLPALRAHGLRLEVLPIDRGAAQFDLTVIGSEAGDGLDVTFEYNRDLFDPATIERLATAFQLLLADAVAQPERRVSQLTTMSAGDRNRLLTEWNETRSTYPRARRVDELFTDHVRRAPDAPAVICGDVTLTYRALDQRATELAGYLHALGIGPGRVVGVHLRRSPDLVVGLMAVHRAGGAYLPLDPATPRERIAFLLRDADARVLLTDGGSQPGFGATVIVEPSSAGWRRAPHDPPVRLTPGAGAEDMAYVIYTSGSTGDPKGVVVPHRALVNLLWSMRRLLGVAPADRLLAVTSVSFDIAALELFLPLIAGATVVLATQEMARDRRRLVEAIAAHGVTMMQATPATWRMVLQGGWVGDRTLTALCGGEALEPELAARLLSRVDRLWNVYGPTETTIWSTAARIQPGQPIVVGRPLANTSVYILDGHREPVPVGVVGELFIGGDGVSLGYLNRPELTAERFLPNPFNSASAGPLFRTGDRARYLADGRIEVLGRLDDQVKLNGFRIELGEVEAALRRHPAVRDVAVVVRRGPAGERHLVAHIVPAGDPEPDTTALRTFLRSQLPAYMVPAAFATLSRLPLTPAGKVDRRALPVVSPAGSAPAFTAPRSDLERRLAVIYAQVLGVDHVGVHDNFFDLGGGSIQILELIVQLQSAGQTLTPEVFFEHQTVADVAAFLGGASRDG